MKVMRFVLWNNHHREWFKILIIGPLNFLVLLPTTKRIRSKNNGVWESGLFGILLGRRVQLYIDGTLKPDPFYQCLMIMAFNEKLGVYVPVLYILMTAKNHWLYWHDLHWVIVATKFRLDPFLVTCDFGKPLHNAV